MNLHCNNRLMTSHCRLIQNGNKIHFTVKHRHPILFQSDVNRACGSKQRNKNTSNV